MVVQPVRCGVCSNAWALHGLALLLLSLVPIGPAHAVLCCAVLCCVCTRTSSPGEAGMLVRYPYLAADKIGATVVACGTMCSSCLDRKSTHLASLPSLRHPTHPTPRTTATVASLGQHGWDTIRPWDRSCRNVCRRHPLVLRSEHVRPTPLPLSNSCFTRTALELLLDSCFPSCV
jgi:hypothetical protein